MESIKDSVNERPLKTFVGLSKVNFNGHETHLSPLVVQGVDEFLSNDEII